jgi:hypothetical protein
MQGASARRRNSTLGNLLTQHLFFKININALRNGPSRMSKKMRLGMLLFRLRQPYPTYPPERNLVLRIIPGSRGHSTNNGAFCETSVWGAWNAYCGWCVLRHNRCFTSMRSPAGSERITILRSAAIASEGTQSRVMICNLLRRQMVIRIFPNEESALRLIR